jgi:predicted MFS family arabinose efflux permease
MPDRGGRRRRGSPIAPWFLPLVVCTVLTQATLNLARPLISYRVIALGGDALEVGLVAAALAVVPLAVAMPLGRTSDRRPNVTPLLFVGMALFVAGPVLLSVSGSILALALASAVLGLAQLVLLVAAQATIARWAPPEKMDQGFGWFTAAASAGQLIGPLLVGLLLGDATGADLASASRTAFLVGALLSFLGVPFVFAVAVRTPRRGSPPRGEDAPDPATALSLLRRPTVPTWLFASLALLGAADILTAYLPLLGERRGLTPATVGLLLALRAAATICSRLLLDRLLRRWPHETLVVASSAGSAVALAVVPLPGADAVVMAAALLVGGFLLGIGQPLTMGLIVRAVPAGARSSGLALRLLANRAGQVALPAMAGVAAGGGGAGALWLACVILAAAAGTSSRLRPSG